MTSQLNPAWQRRAVSSDHLAKISARFLSDGPRPEQTTDGCQVIPFLLDHPDQRWITGELCEVLTQRGQRSLLCELQEDSDGASLEDVEGALLRQGADKQFCLLPASSPATIQACRFDHVVLLVPASLDAVLLAYQRIKLLSQQAAPDIGIVMVGPRDQHAAWRYFRKLAVGTLRFLDIPLLNLGFLPQQVVPEHNPADHHRQNYLTRISERLLRSEFYCRCRPGTTTQARLAR